MRVASIGECMIEIAVKPGGDAQLASGGDTLNTAVYLARQGVAVDYVTALGDDPYSDEMLARWQAEGVGTGLVPRLPGRVPGLYMIRTDDRGERTFHYWRDRAPGIWPERWPAMACSTSPASPCRCTATADATPSMRR